MKTTINGQEVEGDPKEILELLRLAKNETTVVNDAIPETKKRLIKRKKDYTLLFNQAKAFYESGDSITLALRKAYGTNTAPAGQVVNKFRNWLGKTDKNTVYNTKFLQFKKKIQEGMALTNAFREVYKSVPSKGDSERMKKKLLLDGIIYKRPDTTSEERKQQLRDFGAKMRDIRKETGKPFLQVVKEHGYMLRKKPLVPKDYDTTMINKANSKKFIVTEFPEFLYISRQYDRILESMLKHIIANGGSLNLNPDGFMLGLEDGNLWREFCLEIERKSESLRKYFNVTGRFIIQMQNGKYHTIVYRK